ncbi:DUF6932 family protein [Methanoculleus bourgensis]|jgi:hypothetical protein|uniref:DUF6932 family protein n=1 Tax=Methanoculleus bourgensis TaxID=83986 RepID=UPI0022EDDD7A|nr:hypothetical protein [Methanoculleus bourgensis]GLI46031.1 hypothetical protein MBOURGENBZM_08230 [Methanoculleus bourgensis]
MIPDFDENGNLPPGTFRPSLTEFKRRFVEEFSLSTTRAALYINYIAYCGLLCSYDVASRHWVDGSYTTAKSDPQDIDMVIHLDGEKFSRIPDPFEFRMNFNPDDIHALYDLHTFIILHYPEGDPRENFQRKQCEKCKRWFTRDRNKNQKGIIEFDMVSEQRVGEFRAEAMGDG